MKKKIIALLFFFIFASFAATVNINTCGKYEAPSSATTYNITGNVYANAGSTITNGACLYFSNATVTITPNNFTVFQNGSSATIGVLINATSQPAPNAFAGSVVFGANTELTITGFQIDLFAEATPRIGASANSPAVVDSGSVVYLNLFNATKNLLQYNSIAKVSTYQYNGTTSMNGTVNIKACNFNGSHFLNLNEDNVSKSTIGGINIYDTGCEGTNTIANWAINGSTWTDITGQSYNTAQFKTSNKLFLGNSGNSSIIFNISASGLGNITLKGMRIAYNYTNTSPIEGFWFDFVNFTNGSAGIRTGMYQNQSFADAVGKSYYAVGGYYNPLYFKSQPNLPFVIYFPDLVQTIYYPTQYSSIKFFWFQGTYYLVASSYNTTDQYFTLQQNGQYLVEINGTTNTSILNNCPSAFTICTLVFGNNSTSYTVLPYYNPNGLWSDISYGLFNRTANGTGNWITIPVNYTYQFNSSQNDLQSFSLLIYKFYNFTTTVWFNQTYTNNNGGTFNFTINETGRYDIIPSFQVTGLLPYTLPTQNIWLGNATGIPMISQSLPSMMSGFHYAVLCLILSVFAVITVTKFSTSLTGGGIVGMLVFDFLSAFWWDAPIAGALQLWAVALITTIATLFWVARQG